MLVSIDHYTGWPEAKFLRKPNTEKVIEFLKKYITRHGIPKKIKPDPASIFQGKKFKTFFRNQFINHVECPIKDHRSMVKIKLLIRMINERLHTDKKIITTKDKSGLSEILFALRMNLSAKRRSPYECYTGQEANTIKGLVTNKSQFISETSEVELTGEDFESGQDSSIMVRERTPALKLEGAF